MMINGVDVTTLDGVTVLDEGMATGGGIRWDPAYIPGRHDFLMDEDGYSSTERTIQLLLEGPHEGQAAEDAVRSAIKDVGINAFSFAVDGGRERFGAFVESIPQRINQEAKVLMLHFTMQPFSYGLEKTVNLPFVSLTIGGTKPVAPVFRITGTGVTRIQLSGKTLLAVNNPGFLTIDCARRAFYTQEGSEVARVVLQGDFFELGTGKQLLSVQGYDSGSVSYRERWD